MVSLSEEVNNCTPHRMSYVTCDSGHLQGLRGNLKVLMHPCSPTEFQIAFKNTCLFTWPPILTLLVASHRLQGPSRCDLVLPFGHRLSQLLKASFSSRHITVVTWLPFLSTVTQLPCIFIPGVTCMWNALYFLIFQVNIYSFFEHWFFFPFESGSFPVVPPM